MISIYQQKPSRASIPTRTTCRISSRSRVTKVEVCDLSLRYCLIVVFTVCNVAECVLVRSDMFFSRARATHLINDGTRSRRKPPEKSSTKIARGPRRTRFSCVRSVSRRRVTCIIRHHSVRRVRRCPLSPRSRQIPRVRCGPFGWRPPSCAAAARKDYCCFRKHENENIFVLAPSTNDRRFVFSL